MTEHKHLSIGTPEERVLADAILKALATGTPEDDKALKLIVQSATRQPLTESLPYLVVTAVSGM